MTFDVKRMIIFPIILLVLITTAVLSIAEFSLRVFNIGYGNAPHETHSVFHHVHPKEYRFLSHIPTGEYGGHEIYYDADRLVANPSITHANSDNSTCRVAFLGDSFTEAGQVAYKNSFVGILERNSNCTIRNYGVSSYSPIFYLLQWRRIVKEFNPALVIVELYSNDVSSDNTYIRIAKKDKNGEVIAIPDFRKGWTTKLLRKSYLMRFLRKAQLQLLWMYENRGKEQNIVADMVEENPDISELSAKLIKTLAKEVQASGAQFVFTVVPSKFRIIKKQYGQNKMPQFSDKWKIFAHKNNIPFMDLTEPFEEAAENGFQLFFDSDIHFNENGHIVFASELSKSYPHLFRAINIRLTRHSTS